MNNIRPLLWYGGESLELLKREIASIDAIGVKEFILENRGGNWFNTDFWWELLRGALLECRSRGMRMWLLDDSHVNTGSANDTIRLPENAALRPQCLRIEAADFSGPVSGGALMLPNRKETEQVISISAFRRNPVTGASYGEPVSLTEKIMDGLCLLDLPEGLWRVYFIITADPSLQGMFANYITMLSHESCRHLIDEVHEKTYAHIGEFFGKEFAGFFTDEPAFGNCDGQYGYDSTDHRMGQLRRLYSWWYDMDESLGKILKLSKDEVMSKLPSLWDYVEGISEEFRVAYMDEITRRWQANFSCQIGQWCHEHGVEFIGHCLEDRGAHFHTGWGCGHFFRAMAGQDMAGIDIVLNQIVPGFRSITHATNSSSKEYKSEFYHYTLGKLSSSLAHINSAMHNRAICEVFGAYGWTCSLPVMRSLFNHFLSSGVNNYIPHAYSMHLPGNIRSDNGEGHKAPPGYCMTHMSPTFHFGGLNPQYSQFGHLARYVQRTAELISDGVHLSDVAVYYNAEADWSDCKYCNLDDVTRALATHGIDFDIVPSDTLYEASSVANGQLCINQETYRALVIPMSSWLPGKLLARFKELAQQGLHIFFAGEVSAEAIPEIGKSVSLAELPFAIKQAVGTRLNIISCSDLASLRYYGLEKEGGKKCYLFYNDAMETIDAQIEFLDASILDTWDNCRYAPEQSGNVMRIKLQAQQLLVVESGCNGNYPQFDYAEPAWRDIELKYDIAIKDLGDSDFRMLRAASPAVNLLLEEKLTRACASFRYEAKLEWNGDAPKYLRIPRCGDCAELWINEQYCGLSLGPDARFKLNGTLHSGVNTLRIITEDSPAYFDRDMSAGFVYGTKLPLAAHGFVGDIQIG